MDRFIDVVEEMMSRYGEDNTLVIINYEEENVTVNYTVFPTPTFDSDGFFDSSELSLDQAKDYCEEEGIPYKCIY